VQVIEIDVVEAQALERRVAGFAHVAGATVYGAPLAGTRNEPELGGDHGAIAPSLDRFADLHLGGAVDVGGVEQRDA